MMGVRWIVGLAIVAGVGARVSMLAHVNNSSPTAGIERPDASEQSSLGYPYCYSPDAQIILTVGADGQPGRKGEDDNVDGVTDDPMEMGAVGSDDECLAPSDALYALMQQRPSTRPISNGSFVPCENGKTPDRFLTVYGWFIR